MKNLRKIATLLLALTMVFSLAIGASAASITINGTTNVPVTGKTFNAYKILDLQVVGEGESVAYIYTVPDAMKSFYNTRYTLTGNEGDYAAQVSDKISKESDIFDFAKVALAAAKSAGVTPATATGTSTTNSVTMSDVPLGYYVIEDTGTANPISALILDSTNPNVTATIKADKPVPEKKIDLSRDDDDTTTGTTDYNNAAIGDKVPYVITSQVPDMTGYTHYYYVFNDTLSKGLTFNNDVVITVGTKTLAKDTDYTITSTTSADGTTNVKIVFKNFIQYKTLNDDNTTNDEVKITYSATVNENAVIGVKGNDNKVTLTYSNNPNATEEGTPGDEPTSTSPVGITPEDKTRTFVTDLQIIKVDPLKNRLTGAEFKLTGTKLNKVIVTREEFTVDESGTYWKLKDGTYTTDDPSTEGMDQSKYDNTTTKYKKEIKTETVTTSDTVNATGTVGTDGVLTFTGLAAGSYTITEIKAPDGYNLLEKPINVTIGWTAPANDTADCTWTYTGTDTVNETATNHVTVENKAGTELPSTGGVGTTMFYVIGGALVLAAVVLLVTKKRMSTVE